MTVDWQMDQSWSRMYLGRTLVYFENSSNYSNSTKVSQTSVKLRHGVVLSTYAYATNLY